MISYFAGAAQAHGFSFRVYDFQIDRDMKIGRIFEDNPSLIAVCVRLPGDNLNRTLAGIRQLRHESQTRCPHICLIGHTAPVWQTFDMAFPADSILAGEEAEFITLVEVIERGGDLREVPGLAHKFMGCAEFNQLSPTTKAELDLPRPYHYHLNRLREAGYPTSHSTVVLQTSRGCYANCSFCMIQSYRELGMSHGWRPQRTCSRRSVACASSDARRVSCQSARAMRRPCTFSRSR